MIKVAVSYHPVLHSHPKVNVSSVMLPKISSHPTLKVSPPLTSLSFISPSLLPDTVFDAKRLIGRDYNEASVQQDIKHFPFKVIEKNSKPIIQINTGKEQKLFTPEEISAMVLGKMREIAVSPFMSLPLVHHSFIRSFVVGSVPWKESHSRCCHRSRLLQ